MPAGYELQPDVLLAIVPLVGIVIAYRIAKGTVPEAPSESDTESVSR
jgi:hypothetical protein